MRFVIAAAISSDFASKQDLSRYEYIWILDDDCLTTPEGVEATFNFCKEHFYDHPNKNHNISSNKKINQSLYRKLQLITYSRTTEQKLKDSYKTLKDINNKIVVFFFVNILVINFLY